MGLSTLLRSDPRRQTTLSADSCTCDVVCCAPRNRTTKSPPTSGTLSEIDETEPPRCNTHISSRGGWQNTTRQDKVGQGWGGREKKKQKRINDEDNNNNKNKTETTTTHAIVTASLTNTPLDKPWGDNNNRNGSTTTTTLVIHLFSVPVP